MKSISKFLILLILHTNFLFSPWNSVKAQAATIGIGACIQSVDSVTGVSVSTSGNTCTMTFSYSGEMRTWTIPSSGLSNVTFTIKGAAGGVSFPDASYGANFTGSISSLTGSASVYITVGGVPSSASGGFGGSNGGNGGNNGARGGGGSTDLRIGSTSTNDRMIVAGGGGGSSGVTATAKNGGNASGSTGGAGGNTGTQTSGNCLGTSGLNASSGGTGGKAAPSVVGFESTTCRNAGGGGGGYAGGGGAGNSSNGGNATGGKGGNGSSYWASGFADINSDCGSGCTFWSNGTSNTNIDYSKYTNNSNGSLVLTFSVVTTSSFNSFSVAGSANTATFRTPIVISADVSVASKVTFTLNGSVLPGCKNKPTTGSGSNFTISCTWKPSRRGSLTLGASSTPVSSWISGARANPIQISVVRRTVPR